MINKKTINEVDFSTIFNYAGNKFNVDWNRANDMFFHHSLTWKSYNEYSLNEPLDYIDDKSFNDLKEYEKGYFIINQFMIDNNLKDIFINND